MQPLPRKKRFQIHLSTAVILMIATGEIVWTNVYGWPLRVEFAFNSRKSTFFNTVRLGIALAHILVNAATVLTFVTPLWFVCEWWIRRRASRKGT